MAVHEQPLPRRGVRWIQPVVGALIGLAGLIWIFHDIQLAELRRDFAGIAWIWVIPALACDTFGYVLQGVRWSFLMRTLGPVGPLRATQAIYGGLFVNETLPMRVGEMVRAGIVARWLKVPILRVLPSLAVERLFDAFWLALYIGIVALFVQLPKGFVRAADILGIIVLVGTGLFLVLVLKTDSATAATASCPAPRDDPASDAPPARLGRGSLFRRLRSGLTHLRVEVRAIGRSPSFFLSFALSSLPQACEALALWLLLQAYAIPLSLWSGIAAALILRLGTAIPSAPGNLGTWQLICVIALSILGVPKPQAAGFSLVAFVLLTLPLWILGWWALARAGLTLSTAVRRSRADAEMT
jgi:glycosyltransferase 2 family protein